MNVRFLPLIGSLFFYTTLNATPIDGVAAVVGDTPILSSDILRFKKQLQETPALAPQYKLDPKNLKDSEVLERMIEERVVQAAIKELSISVSDAEVDSQVASIANQNNISKSQLESSLAAEGVPFEVYKSNIKNQLERRALFDRELRKGGGVSEVEIRDLYERTAPVELKLSLATAKTKADRDSLRALALSATQKKLGFAEALKTSRADALGWVNPQSLDSKVQTALKGAQPERIYGPVEIGGSLQVFFVEGNRRGSEEGFQAAKQELMMRAQSADFEQRFQSWVERKKKELNIVVNKS
jgi:peptidyl-prolyl cis-trans isomerase SurA